MGVGNQVSVEFNLLYRWHATVSNRDDLWSQKFAKKVFNGEDASKMSLKDFQSGMAKWAASLDPDPGKRNLDMGSIVRDKDTGNFDDAALVKILIESTEDCACIHLPLLVSWVDVSCVRWWDSGCVEVD